MKGRCVLNQGVVTAEDAFDLVPVTSQRCHVLREAAQVALGSDASALGAQGCRADRRRKSGFA